MAEDKKTWFTKTIARETVEATTLRLANAGVIDAETKELLDNLFVGRTVTANTIVRDEEGNAFMKRCSYFEVYLPIAEFGTVGKDDKTGETKYSYQSKAGAAALRLTKTTLEKALKEADEQLEVDEDIQAWKASKSEAVKASGIKAEYAGEATPIASYEDACEAIA